MTAVHITEAEAGTDEWHAARAGGIGGSEIAAVVGLSPFESRFGLWHRKAGQLGPVEENEPMEWGKLLEPLIARKWLTSEAGRGWAFAHSTGVWHHEDRPWQIATPDRLLVDAMTGELLSLLEIKLSMYGDGWGADGTDEVPPHVRCQVLWYLDVFGLDVAHVVVLVASGLDLRTYTVERDDTAEVAALRAEARGFLADIEHGVRPDIDDHSATYEAVRDLHPEIDGLEVELPNEVAKAFIRAKRAEAAVKARVREATATVADHMDTAGKAVWDGQIIARRQSKNGGTPFVVAANGVADMPDPDEPTWADVEMVKEPF